MKFSNRLTVIRPERNLSFCAVRLAQELQRRVGQAENGNRSETFKLSAWTCQAGEGAPKMDAASGAV